MLRENELVFDELTPVEHHDAPDGMSKGLVPRDYEAHPVGTYGAIEVPLIDRSEWSERCADKTANQSRISDVRLVGNGGAMIPSQDQNGKGYCWAHDPTGAVMLLRAMNNLPYAPLSAYAVACMIKNFRDEGGWAALALDFIATKGVPDAQYWPMRSMSRANDNPNTWKNALYHRMVEGWVDIAAPQYDRKLSFDQIGSLLLSDTPVCGDFNWWGHSVCIMDLVDGNAMKDEMRAESGKLMEAAEFAERWGMDAVTGGFGVRIWNSWGDSWSDRGMGVLTGSKAIPDGAVAPRVATVSEA
jgi:hypothetical protein